MIVQHQYSGLSIYLGYQYVSMPRRSSKWAFPATQPVWLKLPFVRASVSQESHGIPTRKTGSKVGSKTGYWSEVLGSHDSASSSSLEGFEVRKKKLKAHETSLRETKFPRYLFDVEVLHSRVRSQHHKGPRLKKDISSWSLSLLAVCSKSQTTISSQTFFSNSGISSPKPHFASKPCARFLENGSCYERWEEVSFKPMICKMIVLF